MTNASINNLIIPVLSCITLNANELNSLSIPRTDVPSEIISPKVPVNFETYSIRELPISNGTLLSDTNSLVDEYNVLASFADKMLSNESMIDPEIQNIIDEYFWDML